MLDPAFKVRKRYGQANRDGAIAPLFAILCPLMMIFAGFAINLAYMQLVTTELKVATDAACHAGGRAMSLKQVKDPDLTDEQNLQNAIAAIEFHARDMATRNLVGGRVLSVGTGAGSQVQLHYGRSIRANGGQGMYEFSEIPLADIQSGAVRPSSLAVTGNIPTPTVFRMLAFKKGDYYKPAGHSDETGGTSGGGSTIGDYMDGSATFSNSTGSSDGILIAGLNDFNPHRRSIATQVDRDIAMVLDRSGSMLYFKDEAALEDRLYELYNDMETVTTPGYWTYGYWKWSNRHGRWRWKGYWSESEAHSSWNNFNRAYPLWEPPTTTTTRRISWDEYQDATDWLYDRRYSDNVIYQLERYSNSSHTLGSTYSNSERSELTDEMAEYTADWRYSSDAPKYSRWYYLHEGVKAFLDVLDLTDQEELVALVTFNNSATLDKTLMSSYDPIRTHVADINPYGGTAIGDGMTTGLPQIVYGSQARPFAAKTIVVLTDGESNSGQDPEGAVADIVSGDHAVTIHTVTFSKGADQDSMAAVALAGNGRHYHADEGEALVRIFEEIANNLPTILTE